MNDPFSTERSLELKSSTEAERKAINRVVTAIKAAERMKFDDIYLAAHGSLESITNEDEKNLAKGRLAHKKIAKIYKWIAINYLPLAIDLAPEVFDPSLLTKWDDFIIQHGLYGQLRPVIGKRRGLTQRSAQQPIDDTSIQLGDDFYFDLDTKLDGALLTLEGYKGRYYPMSLHHNQVTLVLPITNGQHNLPSLPHSNQQVMLSEHDDAGVHKYIMLISDADTINECASGLVQGHPINAAKLDQMALAFKDHDPSAFEIHRLNVIFKG
ncbi:hypothetical protein [Ahrensia sp. 13_GOM-1096m]|uniref:hypothetical protein n=1 Tax=Ahrensia sp. 13_GOM-1096m TaxID=1380380 RepID=UPI0012DBF373|nr:hypothetical protein [Ahrensia sp. 13_GOM-1096m]